MDHAAATPLDESVLSLMRPYFSRNFYNPSAIYSAARAVRKDIEEARASVAYTLGAKPGEIIFTAGGTEANNLAIHGVMRCYPGSNIVLSAVEHESVLKPASNYENRIVKVDTTGRVDLNDLREKIDDNTVLVSIMQANNEVGTVQPINQVSRLIQDLRRQRTNLPLLLHSDAAQAGNYLDLHVSRLGVDLLTLNGGKIYGPKQSGALYVKAGTSLKPLIEGGGQERGLRSGTENPANIIGFCEALKTSQAMRVYEVKRLSALQQLFFRRLTSEIPGLLINGSMKHRLPNNVHISLPGKDNERLLILLDKAGIAAAAGSACSASNDEPSHVLKAMGLSDDLARSSLRFTMGRATINEAMIDKCVKILKKLA